MAREADRRAVSRHERERHGAGVQWRLLEDENARHLRLRVLRRASLRVAGQVRFRDGLAEFYRTGGRFEGGPRNRLELRNGANGDDLPEVRGAPRSRLSRRAATYRHAIL